MQINMEQVVGGVLVMLVGQGVVLAIAFIAFRAYAKEKFETIVEVLRQVKGALGMDGTGRSAFVPRTEFDLALERADEEHARIHQRIDGARETLREHEERLNSLRRTGA